MGEFFNKKLMNSKKFSDTKTLEPMRREFNGTAIRSEEVSEEGAVPEGGERESKSTVLPPEDGQVSPRPTDKKPTRKARDNKRKRSAKCS